MNSIRMSGRLYPVNGLGIDNLRLKDIPDFSREASRRLDVMQKNYRGHGGMGRSAKVQKLQFLEAADRLRDDIVAGKYDEDIIRGANSFGSKAERTRTALQLMARALEL